MTQLRHPIGIYSEVNVNRLSDGRLEVDARILVEPRIENALTALALDGSWSMELNYGAGGRPFPKPKNVMEPIARQMAGYLAPFSCNGNTEVMYWACGNIEGKGVEPIGAFSQQSAETMSVRGPREWGRQTHCLPLLEHLVQKVGSAPWSIAVILTDGAFKDLEEVKAFSWRLAEDIAAGRRNIIKFVAVGIPDTMNPASNELMVSSLSDLDDLFDSCRRCPDERIDPGTGKCRKCGWERLQTPESPVLPVEPIDLWDHKIAPELTSLVQIFAEVTGRHLSVMPHGEIRDTNGNVVQRYPNDSSPRGVPALVEFVLPSGSTSFTLVTDDGESYTQDISEVL